MRLFEQHVDRSQDERVDVAAGPREMACTSTGWARRLTPAGSRLDRLPAEPAEIDSRAEIPVRCS